MKIRGKFGCSGVERSKLNLNGGLDTPFKFLPGAGRFQHTNSKVGGACGFMKIQLQFGITELMVGSEFLYKNVNFFAKTILQTSLRTAPGHQRAKQTQFGV
jgi:hypothetical protein